MYLKNRKLLGVGIAVVLASILGVFLCIVFDVPGMVEERVRQFVYERSAAECTESKQDTDGRIQCWLNIVQAELKDVGIEGAYRIFVHLYDTYPEFGSSGCHGHAHTIGDTAYYEIYVARGQSLLEYSFPPATKSCGYGFFHGFLEHLMQDHPETEFAVQTCSYLRDRYGAEMSQLENICYHASGHGYMQGEADHISKDAWGDMTRLVRRPLILCSKFSDATPRQREECREGVFNVVSDWMISGNFGLSFDTKNAVQLCDALPQLDQRACYYEFAMKLSPLIQDDPVKAAAYSETLRRKDLRILAFSVMVAGMMQRAGPLDTYSDVFSGCSTLSDTYFETCIRSSVGGMLAHGSPGTEHHKVLIACENADLVDRDGRAHCYSELSRQLLRSYSGEERTRICDRYPEEFISLCKTAS